MSSMLQVIKERVSVRTYQTRTVDKTVRQKLGEFMKAVTRGPFGNTIRFEFVEVEEGDVQALKLLGTYGTVRSATLYIAGAVVKGEGAMEDYGYGLETIILKATELGLGTVWLAGSLNRTTFAQKIGLIGNELLPAVTPVGYKAEKPTLRDRLIRGVARAASRKRFDELFFDNGSGQPVAKQTLGSYEKILEAVRLAPSASNKQPWRIIRETGTNTFHFYLSEDKLYNNYFKDIQMQNIDMGIAMCHFELAAGELGVRGQWTRAKPGVAAGNLVYIVSWQGQS